MKWWIIALIVVGCLVAVLALFLIFMVVSNKKKKKRLQANLTKIQQEKENFDFDQKLIFDEDQKEDSPEIEELAKEERKTEEGVEDVLADVPSELCANIDEFEKEILNKKSQDDDFEDFLNENAFSRKILDETLVNKLRKLSPEMQTMILNSIFNKFD